MCMTANLFRICTVCDVDCCCCWLYTYCKCMYNMCAVCKIMVRMQNTILMRVWVWVWVRESEGWNALFVIHFRWIADQTLCLNIFTRFGVHLIRPFLSRMLCMCVSFHSSVIVTICAWTGGNIWWWWWWCCVKLI